MLAAQFEREGYDIVEGSVSPRAFEMVILRDARAWLEESGFLFTVLAESRPFADIQAERFAEQRRAQPDMVPAGYPTLSETYAEMQAKAAAFPNICRFVDLTATYGAPTTVEGRHLFAVKISDNVQLDEDEPPALIVGAHHVREIATVVIPLDALHRLTTEYGSNATVTNLVNTYEIWIAPIWNPDGYEYMFNVNNLWRKNRRVFPGGVGVDLNRNYPFGWTAACAGSTNPSNDTYKGPSAGSEAETITMMLFSQDRHFAKVQDYHSYGRQVLWEYNCLTHPFASYLQAEAQVMQAAMTGYSNRAPSAEGEHFQWQLARGAMAVLTETLTQQQGFQPSHNTALSEAARVWPGLLAQLNRPIPLTGIVTDAVTGAPVEATITLDGVTFNNGEVNRSNIRFGRYYVWAPSGPRTVRFNAVGYEEASVFIDFSPSVSQTRNIALERECYPDCDQSTGPGVLDIFDFLCFSNLFDGGAPFACDCDVSTGPGVCDIFDFLCFSNSFSQGCN